jgi:hypothetical protein
VPHLSGTSLACALRSARLSVNLIGSPTNYANRLIGSPITSKSTVQELREFRASGHRGFESNLRALAWHLHFSQEAPPRHLPAPERL